MGCWRKGKARLGTGLFLAAFLGVAAPSWAGTADEVLDCYRMFSAAYFCDAVGNCSMKHKLVPVLLRFTHKCILGLLSCQVKKETSGGDQSLCFEKALKKCRAAKESIGQYDAGRFATQRENVEEQCSPPVSLEGDTLAVEGGMGFSRNGQVCSSLGVSLEEAADLTRCADLWLQCRVEELVATLTPRAKELLDARGLGPSFTPSNCMLPEAPGNAEEVNRRELLSCEKSLQKHAERFVKRKMVFLGECADGLFRCQVQGERGELDRAAFESCLDRARTFCSGKIASIGQDEDTLERKMAVCEKASLDDLRNGLGLGAGGHPCSGATSSADLIQFLADEVECWVEEVVGHLKPRAAELLGKAGLSENFPCLE